MKIGPYNIDEGAFLAPMAGITNPPFRQLCREMGAAFTGTELISAHALVYLAKNQGRKNRILGEKTLLLLERYKDEHPFTVQIFGRLPDQMAEAARIGEANGADMIDLNFGCPARKVVKNGEGAGVALMLNPPLLKEIASTVVESVSVPVTAKIRLGWSPDTRCAPEVAKCLEDAGVQAICVHARTRDQVHSGPIDLDTLGATCRSVGIPVIGNGGIRSREDALEMIDRTGCKRVAIGQAAKGNPWIFSKILGQAGQPGLAERRRTFQRHFDLYVEWAGERRAVLEMRKHACWYFKGFEGAAAIRQHLAKAADVEAFQRLIDGLPK